MNEPREVLLVAWQRWDAYPKDDGAANAMVDACHAYEPHQTLYLRRFMANARRHGAPYERVLDLWESDEW